MNPDNPPFDAATSDFAWLTGQVSEIINIFVIVIFTLTFVFMLWQIINGFIISGGDQAKVAEAKKTIGFSFLILITMSAIWGIVALLRTSIIG